MVDVAERREVPARRAVVAERAEGRARLRRAHDADLDAAARQPLVELARAALGVGALPVDDQADGDALRGLREEHVRERVADDARPEAELVDVHRRFGRRDVREHARVERRALDEHLGRRGGALREREREVGARARAREQALGVLPDPGVGDRRRECSRRRTIRCEAGVRVESGAMGRGSRPIRRWRNDRQRKKKERDKRQARRRR